MVAPDAIVEALGVALESRRNPDRALKMAAYMRNLFPFLGIPSPERASVTREVLKEHRQPLDAAHIASIAVALWQRPEREYQYSAIDVVVRNIKRCDARLFSTLETLITTKSWWDTVDALAANAVGPLVRAELILLPELDRWIASDNIWLARSAILFQLRYGKTTDSERLFRYCLLRGGDADFFLRKAIGWALREYSKSDAGAVRAFVASNEGELSPLSRREALLWLNGGRTRDPVRASARA